MKIRLGFVSNSSSSSFCIYGIKIDKSAIMEQETIKSLLKNKFSAEELEDFEEDLEDNDEDFGFCEIQEQFEELLEKFGLYGPYGPYDWNTTYIGRSWASMEDEETAEDFKSNIQVSIKMFFDKYLPELKPDKCQTHQEAWHD